MPFQGDARIYVGTDLIWQPGGSGSDVLFPLPANSTDNFASWLPNQQTIARPGTAFTTGAWNEIDASLSEDMGAVCFFLAVDTSLNGANSSTLIQLATGAAASEVPFVTFAAGYLKVGPLYIPGFIAAGSRLSWRIVSAAPITGNVSVRVSLIPDGGFGACTDYGTDLANAQGVLLTYSGSTATKSAWVEITASTTDDIDIMYVGIQGGGDADMANFIGIQVDIGVGAASSETVVGSVTCVTTNTENIAPLTPQTFRVPTIPAGSRLSARYATGNGANGTLDVSLVTAGVAP